MKFIATGLVLFGCLSTAQALVVSGSGAVTDWGVTPFSSWTAPGGTFGTGGTQNDYSPVNYPGIGHVPSPGGTSGERFDLEALYSRVSGGNFQVLLVTSMPLALYESGWKYTYRLGDLFINTDADAAYELALVSQDSNAHGFVGGELRSVSETHGILTGSGGYGGTPAVASIVNPWALKSGALLATGTLASAYYAGYSDSNGPEPAWLYEWSVPASALGLGPGAAYSLHLTIECGNDLIQLSGQMPPPPNPPIPEPMTVILSSVAIAALSRRVRNAA